ncbi:MAG: aspartate aminotransferase family protein, partial [Gemmatimonadota bacterium]
VSEEALGALLPRLRVTPPGPASRALSERLRAVESRNVTYVAEDWPVFWEEAAGCNVRDADGNVYVDFTGGFGVALLGHSSPGVVSAVKEQVGRLVHGMGDVHPPTLKVELLERLAELTPWASTHGVLASTGSEAVEIALKTAWLASGRPGVLALEGAYHGLTLGSLAVTSRPLFREAFERRLYGGVAFAPFPEPWRPGGPSVDECLGRVADLLPSGAPNGDAIGTVIVEPIQGRAGVRIPPPDFMVELSRMASEAGVLVVADEVFTGMGRCGAIFASEVVGLRPDMICVGKALGAGLPVSACLADRSVMDAWPESGGEAIHTSSFLGHPLSCAAALAALDEVGARARVERSSERGARLLAALDGRLSGVAGVGNVRGAGLLVGIELVEKDGAAPAAGAAAKVASIALREGLLVLPAGESGQVIELTPALGVTDEQIDFGVEVLVRALDQAS